MKKIIIFYEVLCREYYACKKLRNILQQKYDADVKIYSIVFEYYKAINFAKKHIDCVIMPWMKRSDDYFAMTPFIKINPGVKIINLNHEQIASDETISLILPECESTTKNVYHLCWGEYFKNLLIENGVPKSHAIVSGNIRLDLKKECKLDRKMIAKKYGLNLNKKWILYAESRDWVLDDCYLKQRIELGLSEELENDSWNWNDKYIKEIYRQINDLDDKFFEQYEFVYRPHPTVSNPKDITNENVKIITDYSIYEWLKNVDHYISSASTSAFEAESIGLDVVCFELKNMPKTYKTYGLENYYTINDLKCINEDLFKEVNKKWGNKNIFLKYIGDSEGKNCEKTADIIYDIIKKNKNEVLAIPEKIKSVRLSKRLKEFIKNILFKTGFVYLLKSKTWCNLAYKDYPNSKKNKMMYGIKDENRK